MKYSFHPLAEEELNTAIDYYEKINPKLSIEFYTEVYNTIQRIIEYPNAWVVIYDNDQA